LPIVGEFFGNLNEFLQQNINGYTKNGSPF